MVFEFSSGEIQEAVIDWHVYIILCSDHTLYTGITTHVQRRFGQHATGTGAKYFRGRQPLRLVYLEGGHTRSSASMREAEIKGMTRAEKMMLADSWGYVIFTDGSVNPQRKCGVGGYVILPYSYLQVPPQSIEPATITERFVMRRFEETSSTKLKPDAVWSLEELGKRDTCWERQHFGSIPIPSVSSACPAGESLWRKRTSSRIAPISSS